jgi:hypothetical protein
VDNDPAGPPAVTEAWSLVGRARGGDASALPALRDLLDRRPDLWRHYGDLAEHAEVSWVAVAAGTDLMLAESLRRKAAEMRAELAGPAPTPLERLLADRAVACWLQVNYCDAAAARAGGASVRQAALASRRQESAQRRFLQAIGALAALRRLMPPAKEVKGLPCDGEPVGVEGGCLPLSLHDPDGLGGQEEG